MILLCAVLFFVLYRLLEAKLFHPFIGLVEARESATIGAEAIAEINSAEAIELVSRYELELTKARARLMEERMRLIGEAKRDASAIIEAADGKAQEEVRNVRWDLLNRREEMRRETLKQAQELADELVAKLKNPPATAQARVH